MIAINNRWIETRTMRSLLLSLLLGSCLLSADELFADNAVEIATRKILGESREYAEFYAPVLKEVIPLLEKDPGLRQRIENQSGFQGVYNSLFWAAARSVSFDQTAFVRKFPNLTAYGRVVLVSAKYFGSSRIIFRMPKLDITLEACMLYGDSATPLVAESVEVKHWTGNEGLDDWDGPYSFEDTKKGPYLCRTSIGRQTHGASTVRHNLCWVRVEATRLVPERCEGYSVPPGEKRQPKQLTASSYPVAGPAPDPPPSDAGGSQPQPSPSVPAPAQGQ